MIEYLKKQSVAVKLAILACGIGFVSFALWTVGRSLWSGANGQESALLEVRDQVLREDLNLTGRLEAGTVYVITAPFDGHILQRDAEDGQRVEQGQVLLELDTSQILREIADARMEEFKAGQLYEEQKHWRQGADVSRARRTLANSRLNHEETLRKLAETRALFARGIVARMEVDALEQQEQLQKLEMNAAVQELQSAEARGTAEQLELATLALSNARLRHEELRRSLEKREIHAPANGVLIPIEPAEGRDRVKAPMQAGAAINRGQALLAVASTETFKVTASVDEIDINRLQTDLPVSISGTGFEGILKGRIQRLAAQALPGMGETASARYVVTVAIDEAPEAVRSRLRIGMSVNLSIVLNENPRAIIIPPDAIIEENGQHFVLVIRSGMPPEKRKVEPHRAALGGVAVSGLRSGEKIQAAH